MGVPGDRRKGTPQVAAGARRPSGRPDPVGLPENVSGRPNAGKTLVLECVTWT